MRIARFLARPSLPVLLCAVLWVGGALVPCSVFAACKVTVPLEGLDPAAYPQVAGCLTPNGDLYTTLWASIYPKAVVCPATCESQGTCPGTGTHDGVDIFQSGGVTADTKPQVYAVAKGTVETVVLDSNKCIFNGSSCDACPNVYGTHVVLRHGPPDFARTYFSSYFHLSKAAAGITRGAIVECGQRIGNVGNTGCTSDPGYHLHFQIDYDRSRGWSAQTFLQTLAGLPPPFAIGDEVKTTTSGLRVRRSPSLSGVVLASLATGTRGQVVGGPVQADAYTWWEVAYDVKHTPFYAKGLCPLLSPGLKWLPCYERYARDPILALLDFDQDGQPGPRCGNRIVEPPEECDDGNTVSGDCCSVTCSIDCVCRPGLTLQQRASAGCPATTTTTTTVASTSTTTTISSTSSTTVLQGSSTTTSSSSSSTSATQPASTSTSTSTTSTTTLPTPICGDGMCNGGDTTCNCPGDCGMEICGNGSCCGQANEACSNCPQDCGICPTAPPVIDSLTPTSVTLNNGPLDLRFDGRNFDTGIIYLFRGPSDPPGSGGLRATPVSSTLVTYHGDTFGPGTSNGSFERAGTYYLQLFNPVPSFADGQRSNTVTFTIYQSVPVINQIVGHAKADFGCTSAMADAGLCDVRAQGSGFTSLIGDIAGNSDGMWDISGVPYPGRPQLVGTYPVSNEVLLRFGGQLTPTPGTYTVRVCHYVTASGTVCSTAPLIADP